MVTLIVDGAAATFSNAGSLPVDLRWPGNSPGASIGFVRIPAPPTPVPPRAWPGDWGLAAMMHDLGGRSATDSGVTLTVNDGTVGAVIRLTAASGNPFATADLVKFQCPVKL